MKYNESISDYNSEQQKSEDRRLIGNVIFNRKQADILVQKAWMRIADYTDRLEKEV